MTNFHICKNLREAQSIFFDHVRTVIFQEHELWSLQGLFLDYRSIISRYGFPTSGIKSSYIKDLLIRECKDKICFQSRPQKNQGDLVYDMSGGGSYVEAALHSIGVSSEQLVYNVADRLRDDIKSIKLVTWSPRVEELEEEEELSPWWCNCYLLCGGWRQQTFLQAHAATRRHTPPHVATRCHNSLITQYVLKRPTTTSTNATVTLWLDSQQGACWFILQAGHGNTLQKRPSPTRIWIMHDIERCSVCPDEIAEGEPSISIIDNDDFRNDTLTGGGTAHRTNCMFLQRLDRQWLQVKHPGGTCAGQRRPNCVADTKRNCVWDAGSCSIQNHTAWWTSNPSETHRISLQAQNNIANVASFMPWFVPTLMITALLHLNRWSFPYNGFHSSLDVEKGSSDVYFVHVLKPTAH